MSWRIVIISNHCKLDFKMDYLVVRSIESTKRIHLSEIAVLIIENTAVSLTSYLLCELISRKIKVIFCDHQRNPISELLPCIGKHNSTECIRQQIKWSPEVKARLWSSIVAEKIRQQSRVLRFMGLEEKARQLDHYIKQVELNDATNREGHAAKVYFNSLFGMNFSRSQPSAINAALNYGYAIVLSALNREIVAAGLLTQLGIFHDNGANPFNLACDLIEPLRPLVDNAVIKMKPEKLETGEKLELINLLNKEVIFQGQKQHLLYALRLYSNNFFRCLETCDSEKMSFIQYEL